MNRSPRSRSHSALALAAALILAGFVLARPIGRYFDHAAHGALNRATGESDPARALVWLEAADTLAPRDHTVIDQTAQALVSRGEYVQAIKAYGVKMTMGNLMAIGKLQLLNQDTKAAVKTAQRLARVDASRGALLKSMTLLESNDSHGAIAAIPSQAVATDQDLALQLGLSQLAADNSNGLDHTIGLLGQRGAARTLAAAQADPFSQAQALYVSGLLASSQRVLLAHQVENSQYYLLRAQVTLRLGQISADKEQAAKALLIKAITLSPERTDTRRLLESVDKELGDSVGANEQASKVQAILAGKV